MNASAWSTRRGRAAPRSSTAPPPGVHRARRVRPVVVDQPHLIHGARLRRCDVVHHEHARVLLAGEHHGRCAAQSGSRLTWSARPARRTPARRSTSGAGRSAMPDPECAESDDQRGRSGQHGRLPALGRGPQLRAPVGGPPRRAPGRAVRRGGSTAVAAEMTAMVSRTARTSSANARATSGGAAAIRRSMSARSDSGIACSAYGVARAVRSSLAESCDPQTSA